MTATAAVRHQRVARWPARPTVVAGTVVVVGCGLLAARPAIVELSPIPVITLVALFSALLVLGARLRLPTTTERPAWTTVPAILVGVAAFGLGRLLVGGHPPAPATGFLVAANTFAAVAEEAWFRRLCFGLLRPAGTAIAVGGSAVLFAAVHVSIYGLWVLPLDLAAGLLLGWQRSSTGSWKAPAITHVIANLLVVL
ncbi:MAG: CPBP family glutamic-type intramembrane protease [Acidimicrobiia bacterium]